MSVLITGGLGFIGSHVVREFLETGSKVVASRFGGEPVASFLEPYLPGPLAIEQLDIASPHAVIDVCRRHSIESIIHFAGPTIGAMSAIEEYRINMAGLLNIMEAARIVGARRVSIASSIAVYMGMNGPFHEDMPARLRPGHPIEAFKKAEELLGSYLASSNGTEMISLRMGSIYGPLYRTLRHWPAQLVHAAVRGQSAPLPIPGLPEIYSEDHATDLCYVDDCARGVRLVHNADSLRHTAYNIGGGQDVTNARYAEAAKAVFPGIDVRMREGTGPNNWPHAILDLSRAAADAGYSPTCSIETGMERYATWLRDGQPF